MRVSGQMRARVRILINSHPRLDRALVKSGKGTCIFKLIIILYTALSYAEHIKYSSPAAAMRMDTAWHVLTAVT